MVEKRIVKLTQIIMKRFSRYLMFLVLAMFTANLTMAQVKNEKNEKNEIHLKLKVIEDGKETVIDTVFQVLKGEDEIREMLLRKGISDSLMSKHHMLFLDEDGGKHHKMVKAFRFSSDSLHDVDFDKNVKVIRKFKFSDDDASVFVHSGDSLEKEITIEILEDGDHKMHHFSSHGKKGEKVIIIKDSDDVQIIEEDGYKIIKIKKDGTDSVWIEKGSDNDVDVDVDVEVLKSGKAHKVKKMKRKKKKE